MNTAILFAAGRGLRLRPLTDSMPKPLCTINQKALIDYHLEKLIKSPIKRVLINHAYLGDQIKRHIDQKKYQDHLDITYLPEPPGGLHTGGTLINARPHLDNTPFLAINADIFTTYDFSTITCPKDSLAHLVLIQKPTGYIAQDFGLTPKQQLSNLKPDCLFSGIACYHPKLFEKHAVGRQSLIPWLRDAADKGLATGEYYQGLWFDTGNPERLERARQAAGAAS